MPFLVQFIFISIITALSATTVAAPTINVQTDKASYTVGEQITISITLSDAPMIYGGGLDLTFNPAVVNANSVQVDPLWDFTIKEGIIDNAAGIINDIFFTHFSGIEGDISVATIVLNTIASGSAGIAVTESPVKPFTDTGGENVVFTSNNLAGNVLVNNAQAEEDQADAEQTTDEQTTTDQAATDQPETQQTATDNGVYLPADRPSDNREQSDTIENTEQRDSDTFISNTQQAYAETDSYRNGLDSSRNPSTASSEVGLENNYKGGSYHPATQASSTTDNNSVPVIDKVKTDDSPVLLITIVFLILALIGYKVFVYRKK